MWGNVAQVNQMRLTIMAITSNTQKRTETVLAKTIMRAADGIAQGVRFEFSNGQQFHVMLSDLFILPEAACHGISQKVGDAAAMSRNPETGKSATVDDKYNAAKAVADRILAGQWNAPRDGNGRDADLLRALIQYYAGKRTEEQVRAAYEGWSAEQRRALERNEQIAAIIARIKATRVDATIDTDELLSEV